MANRKVGIDEAKIARLYKEGRGQGQGADYVPWLKIYDIASQGRSHRAFGFKARRIHHLLSDGEWRTFLHLDRCDDVIDVREQFPLDRKITCRIAESLDIRHPMDAGGKTPQVMTTDFLVDVSRDGKLKLEACAVKLARDLENARTLEKLEIERRFWSEQKVPWRIFTDKDFNPVVMTNLEWLQNLDFSLQSEPWGGFHRKQSEAVCRAISRLSTLSLREFCRVMDQELALEIGSTLTLMRHLLLTRSVTADLTVPLNDRRLMADFSLVTPLAERDVAS